MFCIEHYFNSVPCDGASQVIKMYVGNSIKYTGLLSNMACLTGPNSSRSNLDGLLRVLLRRGVGDPVGAALSCSFTMFTAVGINELLTLDLGLFY